MLQLTHPDSNNVKWQSPESNPNFPPLEYVLETLSSYYTLLNTGFDNMSHSIVVTQKAL